MHRLISENRLDKYLKRYVIQIDEYYFQYDYQRRDTRFENIAKFLIFAKSRDKMTKGYKIKLDDFVNSFKNFKPILYQTMLEYCKDNKIRSVNGKMLTGSYEDLFDLNTKDVYNILYKSFLKYDGTDIWKQRINGEFTNE